MYKSLKLQNFTVFADANFEFVKGVNVYTGANGSGKTHILKMLYALQKNQVLAGDPSNRQALDVTLMSVYKPESLGRLVRRQRGSGACDVFAIWNKKPISFHLASNLKVVDIGHIWKLTIPPILIPAKDILGHSKNFIEAYNQVNANGERWLDFDVTYYDLIVNASPEVSKGPIPAAQEHLLESLRKLMTGTVTKNKSGRYYLKDSAGQIEFPLVAEGWRKVGLLWTLIRNGSLTKGSILYWDEPEANLNPIMFPVIAEVLAKLAESGTQVHIATHSYAFLSELEHAATQTNRGFRIFALDRTKQGVEARPFDRFVDLKPNLILDEYERLYQLTIEEALKGG